MRCPLDKNDMIVVEHQRIELDFCLKCAGVWLDTGELDLLISALKAEGADLSQSEMMVPQSAEVGETKRKCPICGRKMNKVWIGKTPRVLIDSCPIGDGLWFDGGELAEILCGMQPIGSKSVISFLGKAFEAGCKIEKKQEETK
jgi:uncharacterized protein